MMYNVGDKVRVTDSPLKSDLPDGTLGTVVEVVDGLGYFVEATGVAKTRGVYGHGWALTGSEIEKIEENAA